MSSRKRLKGSRLVSRRKVGRKPARVKKEKEAERPQLNFKSMPGPAQAENHSVPQSPNPAQPPVKRVRLSANRSDAPQQAQSRSPQLLIQRLVPPEYAANPQFREVINGLKPGVHWGQYKIVRPIQMGLTGAAYEAQQHVTGQRVALKFLDVGQDAMSQQRFMDSATRVQMLQHESICNLLEFYWQPPYAVLVHELLTIRNGPAMTLEDYCLRYIPKGAYPPEREVLKIAYQLVTALADAHGENLIHGDLKPSNLVFCQAESDDGSLRLKMKVTDLGCAQILGDDVMARKLQPVFQSADDADLPAVATAAFLGPEQWNGAPAGKKTDIFSAAAVIHYFLTRSYQAKRKKPSSRRPEIHEAWDPVICKALRTDPVRRYDSAAEFADALSIIEAPNR